MILLDGKKVRESLLKKYKNIIDKENLKLTLAIINVGNDKPSEVYINNKIKYCNQVGVQTKLFKYDSLEETKLIELIESLNNDSSVTGMIVQSPVPSNIDFKKCINHIKPSKDIDGLTESNFYKLSQNQDGLRPCTSKGIMNLLEYYNIDVTSKNVCIIGRGSLVGMPLFYEMINHNATVTLCHSKTKSLSLYTKNADIIVCGCGKSHLLTNNMVKDNTIVIDAGITVENGHIIGDVDFENVKDKCSYITPNPGGVGPMTIATIIENVIKAGRSNNG